VTRLLVGALFLTGCVYLNTLYNARTLHDAGDRARLAGRAEAAESAYRASLEGAGKAFRQDTVGEWASASLLLVGRNHVRLQQPEEARAALETVLRRDPAAEVALEARVFLGAALVEAGEHPAALRVLNQVLGELPPGELRAEAHVWRARVLLAQGRVDQGWWDLERAVELDERLRVPTQLERLRWAIVAGDAARSTRAVAGLVEEAEASIWADSMAALVEVEHRTRGPATAASLLAPARTAAWAPAPRDSLLLLRADLLLAAAETLAVESELGWMARRAGPGAAPALLGLARIRLRRLDDPAALGEVRDLLLPASGDSAAVQLLEDLRTVELLAGRREDRFAARFVAAEMAQDVLGSPGLARRLYQAAALEPAAGAWRGKAALAALALADDPEVRWPVAELVQGMDDPYVTWARNRYLPGDTLVRLDAALQPRLDSARVWARREARRRDVLVRTRANGG
jgi:hypothetical protein